MKLNNQREVWQALLDGKTVAATNGKKYKFIKDRLSCYDETLDQWIPSVMAFYAYGYSTVPEVKKLYKFAYFQNGRWHETRDYYETTEEAAAILPFSEYLPKRLDYTELEIEDDYCG